MGRNNWRRLSYAKEDLKYDNEQHELYQEANILEGILVLESYVNLPIIIYKL